MYLNACAYPIGRQFVIIALIGICAVRFLHCQFGSSLTADAIVAHKLLLHRFYKINCGRVSRPLGSPENVLVVLFSTNSCTVLFALHLFTSAMLEEKQPHDVCPDK